MADNRQLVRRLKGALLLIGILALGSIVVMFARHRAGLRPGRPSGSGDKNNATISLEGVHHETIRVGKDGAADWFLDAKSADFDTGKKQWAFKVLHVTFFTDKGDKVSVSAGSGTYRTDSNDLEVSGNVMVKNSKYELRTEALMYLSAKRMFVSRTPATIESSALRFSADRMEYDLDKDCVFLNGNVRGVIGNNSDY